MPKNNFKAGKRNTVSENGSTEEYLPFTKQESSDLVDVDSSPTKNLLKAKINLKKVPLTDIQQSLSDCKGECKLLSHSSDASTKQMIIRQQKCGTETWHH